jgi:fructokinase
MKPLVVGLGEILWDLLPEGKELGGAPANFAYHADRLGAKGIVVSSVGDDALGREILATLQSLALSGEHVRVQGEHPTGTVSVDLNEQGMPRYTIHEGVAWDFIPSAPELDRLARQAHAVCVGSLAQRHDVSRRTVHRFLDATAPSCWRVFDLNLRQRFYTRDIIETTLKKTRLFKLNDEEWPVLADMLGVSAGLPGGLAALRERFRLDVIALTRGAEGSLICYDAGIHALAGRKVKVVDTVGAGDAFTAALLMGIMAGRPVPEAHEHAARLAAYVCTRRGATPDIPPEPESCD